MSMMQFFVLLGLYDEAYIDTEENEEILTAYPRSLTLQRACSMLCGQG